VTLVPRVGSDGSVREENTASNFERAASRMLRIRFQKDVGSFGEYAGNASAIRWKGRGREATEKGVESQNVRWSVSAAARATLIGLSSP